MIKMFGDLVRAVRSVLPNADAVLVQVFVPSKEFGESLQAYPEAVEVIDEERNLSFRLGPNELAVFESLPIPEEGEAEVQA